MNAESSLPSPAPACSVSVIITTHNRRDDLRACLLSLPWREIEEAEAEVLVYDDGSTDGTAAMTTAEFSGARLLVEANRGLCAARNQAVDNARGLLLLIIDDDVIVQEGWIAAMLANDDGRTILGGRTLDMDSDRVQGVPTRFTFIGKRLPCRPEKASVGTGCNLGIPAAVFEALGGFDEELDEYGFEESDFCIRANRAGYGFRYVEAATVRHKGSSVKRGRAIHTQERNSTYAMLKAYRGSLWLLWRLAAWGLKLRFGDARLLLAGWLAAYRRFARLSR
ncbi:MAG: glycosyltransferase family 2 protein [Candidatus Hydrogenedentes bacterium]|nr:glycosyltransferase family 2 protein [Candidatus Hydrogenedentota bacterium]